MAAACWDYVEQSADYIFADVAGDRVANRIAEGLMLNDEGYTRTEISNLLGRNCGASSKRLLNWSRKERSNDSSFRLLADGSKRYD